MARAFEGIRLGDWIRVETIVNHRDNQLGLHMGLSGKDGPVTLFHMGSGIEVDRYPGERDQCNLSQRQILEHVIETATKQLAILALEEK